MMTYSVTLMRTIGADLIYQPEDIVRLLETPKINFLHGKTFTGKPCTRLHRDVHTVVKVHGELRLNTLSSKRWVQQIILKEQSYQVHHPHKTWFVVESATEPYPLIGNLCPRLHPLHECLLQPQLEQATALNYLTQLFEHYFRLATTLGLRLDEGLSNFGSDPHQHIYYLDDDVYTWDRFTSCAHMLGVYFRSLPWITPEVSEQLGHLFRQLVIKHFQDAQYLPVLAEQLKDVFVAPEHKPNVTQFIHALTAQPHRERAQNSFSQRYLAILADIHANLPALEAVLAFLKLKDISQALVLGDIVGYGPYPSQCIERIQAHNWLVIKGNHDHALATEGFKKGFSSTAAWVLEWSLDKVSIEQKHWLAELPPLFHHQNWLAVHGAPIDPTFFNAYVYEMTYIDNLNVLQRKKIPLCFHGHTHKPGIYGRTGFKDNYYHSKIFDLKSVQYALACPGSVGQPRNGQVGAQFAIYDQREQKLYYHTILYNVDTLVTTMNNQGFPPTLMALLTGQL